MSSMRDPTTGRFLGVKVDIEDKMHRVKKASDDAIYRNLGHAAASIRKEAVASIKRSKRPSEPESPVHTKRGQAKRAVRYAVDGAQQEAVIGFEESKVGTAMEAHEFGKVFRGAKFPARPTMGPALEKGTPRFADAWVGSIGE